MLELIGALSVVAVPIFVDGVWWGFIGFEDCEHERDWSAAEIDALRAAAGLVAAAVSRERAEQATSSPRRDPRGRQPCGRSCSSRRPTGGTVRTGCSSASASPPARAARTCSRTPRAPTASSIASQGFEWVASGITPELENEVTQDMCYEEVGLARFEAVALRNEIFTGNVRDFPADERAHLRAAGHPLDRHRPDQRRRPLVGLHRLRRLCRGARVERRRAGRAPHRCEPRGGGDRPRARRGDPARARAEAACGLRHGARRDLHHRRRPPLRRRQPCRLRPDRRLQARPDRPPPRRVPASRAARARAGETGTSTSWAAPCARSGRRCARTAPWSSPRRPPARTSFPASTSPSCATSPTGSASSRSS